MAIVQLKSTNPQFTFLIKKNPQSGMQLRPVRKGITYGWYSDDATYSVFFKDADNELSYKQNDSDSFEYLNVSRYNTPLFPLNAVNEFFSTPVKAQDERDIEGYEHTFFINMVQVERLHYIEFFNKHLKDYTFSLQHQAHKSYSLTITTHKSLYHLLHVTQVLSLFLSIFGDEYIDISDRILDKYIRSLNVIDAPFYIRSLFARSFLTTRELFKRYKSSTEQTEQASIGLEYGGTAMQRRTFISGVLPFNKPVLDIGCGEGFYAIPFAGKIESTYYAVDINAELLEIVNRKAKAKQIDNIATFGSLDHFLESYNGEQVDVILTEVVEHMSEDEAAALIRQIIGSVDFGQLIVTTPNADFNRYYELDGFRHEDHKWEMGIDAFREWFTDTIQGLAVEAEYGMVGDRVDDIRTTQSAIVRRKEE
ncbi:class I SAM-dependent methyltransferase [Paenibacillus sp. FSL R10-2736]|uniref:class I SAM-dependent methyltransferase n=1 Tax=Paenibacillus sp. FSL R10-2736 TaxID=2954692 RepID=UPI0030F80EE4